MANNKKSTYMTVGQIRRQERENRFKKLKFDDDKTYSVDEIRQAAIDQGLIERPEPTIDPLSLNENDRQSAESENPLDLRNSLKKIKTETIPKIQKEAIRNYNLSKVGRDYLSKYDDSTSYADIQKDIAEVQSKKGEDEYDLALAMLKNYVNQKYDLNGTDLSQDAIKRRQEVYDYNQKEIDNLNSKIEANEGDTGSLNLDDEETVSKYLNHDKDAVDFFIGYRSGRITQDAANKEKYITMRNYIENAANSDSVRNLRNEVENLRAQNAAYDRTQGQSDRYALQYGDEVKNEKTDLLAGALHTRNNVPDNFDERVENGNDRFTDMGDISQPAIKRYGGENAVEDYKNMDAHTEMLTSEEKGIYSYLLRNEGKVSANAYLDSLKDVLQKRASETTQEYIDNASGAEKAVLLAASVPMNVYGTATGFAEDAANIAAGKDIHPYSEAHSMYNIAQQTRSSVAEDIDEATNSWNVLGFSAGDAFQAAMSIPDFMLGALTPSYYAASMSMGAAQSTAKELWEEGATKEQIVAESVLSGAAEYVFEKVSLDKIIDTADKSKLVKSVLAGMAVEGSEEANTEIANIISDVLVRGSQSDWHKAIQNYKDQGYSDSESQAKAFSDMAKRVGYSAIGGAIGGAGGGAGLAVEKGAGLIQNKSERNKYIASVGADVTNAGNTQALLDTADQMKDNAEVQAQAQKVRQAQTKNAEKGTESTAKTLSRETGKLYAEIQDSNAQGIQNAEASEIKAAIKQAYAAETGEDVKSDTVTQAAEAIYKSEYTGEKLTRAERNLASTSQAQSAVESVRNNPDLIEQGTQKARERAFNKYISTAQLTLKQETKTDEDVDIAEFHFHKDDGKVYTADGKKQVDIASVASIGKNDITFALKDGQTESAKALDMPTKQAVLAQSVLDVQKSMGVDLTPEIADTLYKGYEQSDIKSVSAYMQDAKKVLFNGYTNNTKIDNTINLPQGLRNQLYSMGRQLAASHTQAQQQAVIGRVKGNKPRKGSVTFVDGIKRGQLDSRRRAGVDTVENLAKSLGFDVVFYRSTKNGEGRYSSEYVRKNKFTAEGQQAPSGFWRGGKMYLDINAGMNGEGLILFTASHELVHMIREGSPEAFQELADSLVKNYAEQGVNINDLVLKEMSKSTNLTRDEAFEEVIAESCETFLRDTHLNDKAQELYKQNPTLWSRIREALKRIINAIKEAYSVARPQSEESRITNRADIETLEKAYDLWTKGIIKSAENLRNMESESTDTKYQSRSSTDNIAYKYAVKNKDTEKAQKDDYYFDVIRQKQEELNSLRHQKKAIIESAEYNDLIDKVVNGDDISKLAEFEKTSGLKDVVLRVEQLQKEISEYNKAFQKQQEQKEIAEEEANREKSGLSEADYRRKLAVKQFGTTPYFFDAGYILPNGEMLNLSGTKNHHNGARGDDHRIVGAVYPSNYSGWGAVTKFMSDGNIRIMPESPGLDIISTVKPTKQQLNIIKRFIEETKGKGYFAVDFTDESGKHIGNLEYKGKFTADGIISDIERYYSDGELTKPSRLNEFRYQSRVDSDYLSAVERGDMETAQRMVDEAAKAAGAYTQYGSYTPELFYHGTRAGGFTEFRYSRNNQTGTDYGKAFYFTTDYEKAAGYAYDISKDSRVNDYKAERDRLTKEFLKSPTTENKERLKKHHETLYKIIDGDYSGGLQEGTEVKSTYLFMKNPLVVDANGEYYYKVYPDYFKAAKQLGSDGIVVHNVVDNPRGKARPITVGIVFESNQIKSADPVTYDDNGDVIPLSERFNESNKDIRYQSRSSTDNIAYKYAVKNKDTEKAQRLVERTANRVFADSKVRGKDGKLRKVYHYTNTDFYSFDTGRSGRNQGQTHGDGIYISTSPDEFSYAGKKRMTLYANITNPFEMELTEEQARDVLEKYAVTKHNLDQYDGLYRNHAMNALQSPIKVFDYLKEYADDNGIKVSEILQDLGFDGVHDGSEWVAFSSEQLKSADPITYDDYGKVIPLSQRFDSTKTDIRYQSRDDDLFSIDLSDDDTITDVAAREFVTHHEDMGEVLKNISDIDIEPKRVDSIINRVAREYLGSLDAEAKHTLSIEIQLALERVNNTDAQTVSDTIIDAVRRAIEKGTVSDERAEANYKDLLDAFKGKKFYLTDEQINQLKEHDMTLDSFRKAMFGKMTIVNRENAKRSINGGYADAQQLSLEGLHDVLADADAVLGLRSWQWDQENYDAPYIIKEAFDGLNRLRNQPVSQVYSDQAIDDMAVAMSAKITGGIVEAKYNSRKNPYITKLVNDLKAKRSEAVKKQKEKNRQKLSELKQKERERAEKRETELKKKYQEQRDKSREGRKRTELRHKIRNLTDSLQKRLTKPKGSQYVPRQLIAQTVDVLNAVNLDTGRSVRLSEKLALLRNEYDKLKGSEESYAMYDGVVSNMLLGLNDTVGNTSIMDMTLSQLKQVYDTIRSMDHVIRESVKMTDTSFKHDAHQVGRDWIAEIRAVPKSHVGALSGYVQTMLSAERFFNRIAGFKKDSTSLKLFDMLNKGQLATTQYEMEFTQIFADLIQDDKIKSLYDTKKMVDIGLVDDDGNKVPITRGMMLSLYMHLQNEDNIRHVMGGGLTVPDMKDYYKGDIKKAFGKGMKSVRVGQLDYSRYAEGIKSVIEKQLTEYERGWIEAAHEFFDEASRKALNETTMKLYGFRRANVDNYFPIHTDSNYRAASFENIVRDMSLENSGFMKERVKASNPILLEDIVDVVNDQISKTAKYCGMTLPIKNFEKVYGTTTVGFDTSVQKELNKKFSASSSNTGATKYIDNLLTDLTSGRSSDDGPIAKWLGHARGFLAQSTLTLNPRVAIAQTASIVTAAPVVGYKNIAKALTSQYFKVSDEEIAKITPLFWLRRQGYATIEIGDIATLRKQKHKIQSKAAKALNWINEMDSWAVRRLFVASKYYMQENYSNLDPQSDEYKQKLSEVYNKVIEKTQPNYTVLQRPDILRNPNALLKSLTMFMTQRLQNFNIIYDSVGTFNKYNADYKAGINNVTADDVKAARSTLIRSITSQVASAATIVGMKLFADFLLHSMNGYRDDDDEITSESLSLTLLDNFADTVFGNILFASELYSAVKSLVFKKRYYGVSLSGISSIVDAITDIINLNNGVTVESVNKVAMSVCQVLGIPLRNAEKIGKAIYYWISDISSGEFMESGIERNTKQSIHRYETKLLSGDNDGAKKIVDEMLEKKKAKGKNDKDAKSDVRSNFTTEYKKRYLEALKSNNAEEIKNIRQILYSSGLYGTLSDLDKVMQKWVAADKKEQSK